MRSRPARKAMRDVDLRARAVRLVVVDLDGVLTDGRVVIDVGGREARVFHHADRVGIGTLVRAGLEVAVLAHRRTKGTAAYARSLQAPMVLEGGGQGLASVRRFCRRRRFALAAVAYVAHDELELPLLQAVGLAVAIADAPAGLRRVAHWTTKAPSGAGVVREVSERILRAQGRWASTLGEIWRRWD